MILAIDIGNTYIKCALIANEQIIYKAIFPSSHSSIEIAEVLQEVLKYGEATAVVISSVVPRAKLRVMEVLNKQFAAEKILTISSAGRLNFVIAIPEPNTLGEDLIAASFIAQVRYPKSNILLLGLGTATTFSILRGGQFIGGIFTLGLDGILTAVNQKFAHLNLNLTQEKLKKYSGSLLQSNTEGAFAKGAELMFFSLLSDTIASFRKEYGQNLKIIATGGGAQGLSKEQWLQLEIDEIDVDLTLKGLYLYYQYNTANGD